jgi:PAS domain-containing protein
MSPPEAPDSRSAAALSAGALALALDCGATATFLVRADGRIVHCNRGGLRLLRGSGALRQVHAYLVARRVEEAKKLAMVLVRVAASCQSELLRLVNRNGTTRLLITVSPIPDDDLVTVCVVDLQASDADCTQWFRQAFQISTQNAELAAGLLSGLSLLEFSTQKEITLGATRTRLKKLFAATGARSQAALVGTLLRAASLEFPQVAETRSA